MKKFIFVCMLILVMSTTVFASDVNVQINGENINFTDSNGQTVNAGIINSRTMVPMRKIFEVLGAEVLWDGENRIVIGTKDEISVQLQIDNNIATKTVNGVTEEIILDTPPMLLDDRTMVPLRFIAESLDKQVGWDNTNRTAIIIDYEYFEKSMETKLPAIYNFLKNSETNNYEANFTHKYYDLANPVNDNNFAINTKVNTMNNLQKINMNISGTSELSKEIISEGWNNTVFDLNFTADGVILNSENVKLKEMLSINQNGIYRSYDELMLEGKPDVELEKMFQVWSGVEENDLNINTFTELKNDFDYLCKLFSVKSGSANELTTYTSEIAYSNYNIKYFDLAKLDNFIFDNEGLKTYSLINKLFFKKDVLKDEMLYDNSSINLKLDVKNSASELNLIIETVNEYNEKNEYILNFKNL